MAKCNQKNCGNEGTHRFTWPGDDETVICEGCLPKLEGVAKAMGFPLQVIALDRNEAPSSDPPVVSRPDGMSVFGTISLGGLIALLEKQSADNYCAFDFGQLVPTKIMSYRGFYDHLAIGYGDESLPSVGEVVKRLKEAIGRTFEGYKGGSFHMTLKTPIWVANYGQSGSTAIVGLCDCSYSTFIKTERVEV